MGRDQKGAAVRQDAAVGGRAKVTSAARCSSLRAGVFISAGLHLGLLATAAIEARPPTLPFAQSEVEPAVITLDVVESEAATSPEAVAPIADQVGTTVVQQPPPARQRAHRHRPLTVRHAASLPRDLSAAIAVPSGRAIETPAVPSPLVAVADELGHADDMEPSAPAPLIHAAPEGPAHVAASVATALRLYDHFPRIPEPLRHQAAEHAMMVDVCVSERGLVSQVSISPTGVELLERTLREAVQTWRYRPLVVKGTARPFCHMLRVVYRTGSV